MSLYSEYQEDIRYKSNLYRSKSNGFDPIAENTYSLKNGFSIKGRRRKSNDIFRSL